MNELLSNLNPEQRDAVMHEKGPLLIIAGAGTGKTHVITSRIIHLLQEKKAAPSEILALTFTEKSTEEMIERVDKALPYSYEEIAIHTFHGFCDRVLKEYGLEIGLDTSYSILTQVDQWMFIKQHLFDFNLDYYRPLGNPNKFISALGTHFSRLKDEDISPEAYQQFAKQQQENDEEEKKRLLEVAKAYETYQELLIQNNVLDFNDLQYYVLRLFEKRPRVLEAYQKRFPYILVDEFQDTNFAQSKIVHMLAEKTKNITVVGDDDQSIYRWRGASMNNINEFNNHFPNARKVVLKENYRSTQEILDCSYELIQYNNPHRLEAQEKIDKKLHSQHEKKSPVEIHEFPHYQQETEFIIGRIMEQSRNRDFNEFAILVRNHVLAKPFIEEFKARHIPFQVRNKQALSQLPEIKDMIAVLRFLTNPKDDLALFRILKMPVFNYEMEKILLLINETKSNHKSIYSLIKEDDYFSKAAHLLGSVITFSKYNRVSRILGEFINQSRYIQYLQDNQSVENEEKIVSIASFLQLIKEYEQSHSDTSLLAFLDYLTLLDEAGATLNSSLTNITQDAVQILTIHAAKGLQFPVVFVPSMVKQRFPGRNRRDPIEIPDELVSEDLPEGNAHIREERRLCYVACTRAKEHLHLTYSRLYQGPKKWKPSIFIEEISQCKASIIKKHDVRDESSHYTSDTKSDINSQTDKKKRDITHNPKTLSYSKLGTFDHCPLKYKFRYIYQIPTPSAHAANFGTSIHNTLKDMYQYILKNNDITIQQCEELYEKNWISEGYESKAHHNTRKKKGWEMLKRYYEDNSQPWVLPAFIEKSFYLKADDHTISGRIDRIDLLEDGTYEVIDYKTGKSKKNANIDKDLQLSLYALACKEVYKISVSKLSLYFLESGEKKSTSRTDEQLEKSRNEIITQACKLTHSDFEATPGFVCKFCEYRLICNKAK